MYRGYCSWSMGSPIHLALHRFDRVPILQHGDFTLCETSAMPAYNSGEEIEPDFGPSINAHSSGEAQSLDELA
jgi:hypothetical protein